MLSKPNIIKNVESEITSKGFKYLSGKTIVRYLFPSRIDFQNWLNYNKFEIQEIDYQYFLITKK